MDLAVELMQASTAFRSSLPAPMAASLAGLVRSMNCYYSNLIEGHDTHPIDIERALAGDYSQDAVKRELQQEAMAHVSVQAWIDEGGLQSASPTDPAVLCELHRRFYERLPDEFRWVENPGTKERLPVIPGAFRQTHVQVGRHVAISAEAVPRFLARMDQVYARAGKAEAILAAAYAHHRLLWVHPFLDGNGRVARLVSHAMLLRSLDTGGLWSVSRGLARRVAEYKQHLQACDAPRRGDLDGRGTLSESALASFAAFFLETALEQVSFMRNLMEPDKLRERVLLWTEEQVRTGCLPADGSVVMRALFQRGYLERGEVESIIGKSDRVARRVTSALIASDAVRADTTRAPLQLAFPARLAERWMPGLFPGR